MSPLHVTAIVYFNVLDLVTERNSHILESLHIRIIHKACVDLIKAEQPRRGSVKKCILKKISKFRRKTAVTRVGVSF